MIAHLHFLNQDELETKLFSYIEVLPNIEGLLLDIGWHQS